MTHPNPPAAPARPRSSRRARAALRRCRLSVELLEVRALLATGALGGAPYPAPAATAGAVLVQVRPGVDPLQLASPGTSWQATSVPGLFEVRADSGASGGLAARLAADPGVAYAEPEGTVSLLLTPNDPKYTDGTLYGLSGAWGIQAPGAWDVTTGSTAVTIADIDTGMDYNHPDLYDNVWINQQEIPASRLANLADEDGDGRITFYDLNFTASGGVHPDQGPGKITDLNGDGRIDTSDILAPMQKDGDGNDTGQGGWADGIDGDPPANPSDPHTPAYVDDLVGWNFITNTNNPLDDHGHGTHTAGTIAGMGNNGVGVAGVNWKAQVMVVKMMDSTGNGTDAEAAAGIYYAAAHGAKVSSNSWGGTDGGSTLGDAIDYAATAGMIFVAAAGNSGQNSDTTNFFPADYTTANVVSVAATDNTGARASFSNYGAVTVDLGAPGVNVYSTYRGNTYATLSGTSMATPHVAGTMALVLAEHPDWPMTRVIDQVLDNTTADAALAGKTVTGGLANAALAVHDVAGPRVKVSSPSGALSAGTSVSSLRLTFSEEVDPGSFATGDLSFSGPSGAIAVAGVAPVAGSNNHQFDVTFAAQSAAGSYTLIVGPAVSDWSGNAMDQNQNGQNGEAMADQYLATFSIPASAPPPVWRFDFGTPSSLVAPGYTAVTPATTYSAAAGFGWTAGQAAIRSQDDYTSNPLTRDYDYAAPGMTFSLAVPSGTYDVAITAGAAIARGPESVTIEGAVVGTISSAAGQYATPTYRVNVADGQLTLALAYGSPGYGVAFINALVVTTFSADVTGARVVSSSPSGQITGSADHVDLTFSEPIQDGSFNLTDVNSLTGPAGAITPSAVTKVDSTHYTVSFPAQSAAGTYSLNIGPAILDLAGNAMDQNQNATNGEPTADRYTATFTIAPPVTALKFDFGSPSSPVAPGYTGVASTGVYSAAAGFGWTTGASAVRAQDDYTSNPLTRDYDYAAPGMTFVVDIPNGTYDVAITAGAAIARGPESVTIEGAVVGTISSAAGQYATPTYRVNVADGQLTLALAYSSSGYGVAFINALVITAVSGGNGGQSFGPMSQDLTTNPTTDAASTNGSAPTAAAPASGLLYALPPDVVDALIAALAAKQRPRR